MTQRNFRIEDYTVGWVCALPVELAAAAELLDKEHGNQPQDPNDTNLYTLGRMGEHNVVIACLPAGQIGPGAAAAVAVQMKSKFTAIRFTLMVGIGGGVPSSSSDVRLGDVVISQPFMEHGGVVQYDFGKTGPNGFTRTGFLNTPPTVLLHAVSKLAANHYRGRSKLSTYLSTITRLPRFAYENTGSDILFKSTYNHAGGPTCARCDKDNTVQRAARESEEIVIHYGTIASGNQVVKDGVTRDRLSGELGGILCFEMEAAGLMNSFPCLVIRGICDYADSHKNKRWQPYAAATAAACAKEIMSIIPASEAAKARTMDDAIEDIEGQANTQHSISTLPFDRDKGFVGREEILTTIDRRLMVESRVAIAGIGGVGKSQIAIEYCYRFQERNPGTSVFWVHASTSSRFQEAYQTIARRIGILGIENPNANIFHIIYDWLSDEKNGSWLMVLDNVDDMETFFTATSEIPSAAGREHTFLSAYLPKSPKGKIMVTTRDTRVGERLTDRKKCIMVPLPAEKDAKILLRSKLSEVFDWVDADALSLVKTLDCLPLAITQAAAFVNENYCTLQDYIEMLQANESDQIELLNEDLYDPRRDMDAPNSVVQTWKLSFDLVRKRKPRAAEILGLMAVLDRQGIPVSLLRRDGERSIDFTPAVGILRSFSLIEAEKGDEVFAMHRLVQLCTYSWLQKENRIGSCQSNAVELLSREFPDGEPHNWKTCELLLPHARKVIGHRYTTKDDQLFCANLCFNMSWYDWSQGQYETANILAKTAHAIRAEFLGDMDLKTLNCLEMLSLVLSCQGQYKEAEVIGRQALERSEKVLGKELSHTLNSASSLGIALSYLGKYKEAEAIYRRALDGREKVLGGEHPDTLNSADNLGIVLSNLGKYKEAEAIHRRALEGREKVLGKEHPDTLSSASNLGSVLSNLGKYEEAELIHRRTLEGREKVLGEEHPDTLLSTSDLGTVLSCQGKYEEAEAIYRRALEGKEKVLGKEHPDTLLSTSDLGTVLSCQGKYEEAELIHRRTLKGEEKVLGKEHPNTLNSMGNLATTLWEQGQWNAAEDLNTQVMEISEKVLGREHPNTLLSMSNLALTWKNQSRDNEALELMKDCLQLRKQRLGPDHPHTMSSSRTLDAWQGGNL